MRGLGSLLVLLLMTGGTCDDNTPVCVPATTVTCTCATGGPGERVCEPDGLAYGECTCLPDAGGEPDEDEAAAQRL